MPEAEPEAIDLLDPEDIPAPEATVQVEPASFPDKTEDGDEGEIIELDLIDPSTVTTKEEEKPKKKKASPKKKSKIKGASAGDVVDLGSDDIPDDEPTLFDLF